MLKKPRLDLCQRLLAVSIGVFWEQNLTRRELLRQCAPQPAGEVDALGVN